MNAKFSMIRIHLITKGGCAVKDLCRTGRDGFLHRLASYLTSSYATRMHDGKLWIGSLLKQLLVRFAGMGYLLKSSRLGIISSWLPCYGRMVSYLME